MTMVDVGGYVVEVRVTEGDGSPVVFVNALGTTMDTWDPVPPLLATRPRIVRYDRAGIGASDPRPERTGTYGLLATELSTLLSVLDIQRCVLVGHSIGSLVVRMLAHRHPEIIAGAVHVDGTIPHLIFLPDAEESDSGDGDRPDSTVLDPLSGQAEIVAATWPRVPTIALVKTPGWHGERGNIDQLWQYNQQIMARQMGAGLIIAKNASHHIQREAPELVAFAVDEVVSAVVRGDLRVELSAVDTHRAGGILVY